MITISNLFKSYGRQKILKGIDLDFNKRGCITAILGPNGSGKTTLIKSILGMVLPEKGKILVDGKSIKGQCAYRSQIDYLPQIAQFPGNLHVQELINMIKDLREGQTSEARLIELFDLQPFLNKKLRTLSGGTKQKVNLTLALMYDSPIVILDEPTSGLDPIALTRLKALIREEKERGKFILLTTHIMSFVEEIADEIVFLLDGNIYFRGSKKELKTQFQEEQLEKAIANILLGEKKKNNIKVPFKAINGKHIRRQKPALKI